MSFIFYDTETTGTDSAFDQILQFAAIKTDSDLNEVERFEIRSRLLPHIIPSPGAIKVTGITVDQLLDVSLPSHYEMVCAIREKLMEWSPAIFVGHNSLFFDEHFLRQAFYQALHPPYLTNTNGNCRSDSMRMIQAASIFSPDSLNIPKSGNKNIFKLGELARLNGFDHSNAHDALADVEVTIHLCRLLYERDPDLWSNLIRFTKKSSVIDYIQSETLFTVSDYFFGRPYSWIVTLLGIHPDRDTEAFVFDLSINPDEIIQLDNDALADRLTANPKPVRRIRTNACPILNPADEAPDIAKAAALDTDELERRAEFFNDKDLSNKLINTYISSQVEFEPSPYVEKQIYDSFPSQKDQDIIDKFHTISWPDRLNLVSSLSDSRLKELSERLICTESPDLFTSSSRNALDVSVARRVLGSDGQVPWLTLPQAIQEAEDLLDKSKGESVELLANLKGYLVERSRDAIDLIT